MYNRVSLCLPWLMIAAVCMGLTAPVFGVGIIELRNAHVSYYFDTDAGYRLGEVCLIGADQPLVHSDSEISSVLWRVELYFPAQKTCKTVDSRDGGNLSHKIEQDSHGKLLTLNWWGVPVDDEGSSLDVKVTVYLPDDDSLARWHMTTRTNGACHVWTADFPIVQGIQDLGDDYLAAPLDWGKAMRDPATRLEYKKGVYPGSLSMQFITAWGSRAMIDATARLNPDPESPQGWVRGEAEDEVGLYLAAEDGEMWYKAVHMRRQASSNSYDWCFTHYPMLPEWPLSQERRLVEYAVPYPVIFGPYAGGIDKAIERYRQWALNQLWASRGPISNPAPKAAYPVSNAIKDTAFWARFQSNPAKVLREVSAYRRDLRVPTSLHWYQYTISQFDDNFPEYLPADPYFVQSLSELKRMGVSVMPYINGLIWDTDTQSFKRTRAMEGAARDPDGKTYDWLLKRNNIHVRMNPTYRPWQDKLLEVADKLVSSYGVNGLYLDVLARNRWLDYFSNSHLPHGGTYWARGNRIILDRMQQHVRSAMPGAYLTSEGCAEVYLDMVDAFLLLDVERYGWSRERWDNYPLYSMVYHDYGVLFGGDAQPLVNPRRTIWQLGLGMIWGAQAMYAGRDVPPIDASERSRTNGRYLREVVQSYHQVGRKFLLGGRWIPTALVPDTDLAGRYPVMVRSKTHHVALLRKNKAAPADWVGPAVLGSSWLANDDSIGIVLTNISSESQEVTLRIDVNALNLNGRMLWGIWPLPVSKVTSLDDSAYETTFTMPAYSVRMFQAGGAKPQPRDLDVVDWQFIQADKEGQFPAITLKTRNLWACRDSGAKIKVDDEKQTLTLTKSIASEPENRTIETIVDWANALEGQGLPRRPSDKPHYVIEQTPYALIAQGQVSAQVSYAHDVMTGLLKSNKPFSLECPPDAVLLMRDTSGKLTSTTGSYRFDAGRYRMAIVRREGLLQSCPEAASHVLEALRELELSQENPHAAVSAFTLKVDEFLRDSATKKLSIAAREDVSQALQAAQAFVWVVTGASTTMLLEHDWLAPSLPLPLEVHVNTIGGDGIGQVVSVQWTPLDCQLADLVSIVSRESNSSIPGNIQDKLQYSCEIETQGFEAIERLLPVVAAVKIMHQGRPFITYAQTMLNIDYPLMVKCEDLLVQTDGDRQAKGAFTINNVSPHAIDAAISIELPEGWRLAQDVPNVIALKPCENATLEIACVVPATDQGQIRQVRALVKYADDPRTEIHDSFEVQVTE